MSCIFLTGGTGTIGSALVPRLLASKNSTVMLLVRARDDAELAQRLQEMYQFWEWPVDDPRRMRVRAVRGDIAVADFGLQPLQMKALDNSVTHIIHCAASVKLNMSLLQARATAVAPTRTILALARRCAEAGQLRKVDLVSTVGVWGRTPGQMPERRLLEVTDFHNTYEAAKAEAERAVWSEGAGLPITVHRPSMVVGEAQNGRVIHFQVFYHLCEFLSGQRTFGVMPHLGHTRLDTVPVDWVAAAIAWSSVSPETVGRIFHLCAGPAQAIALTELQVIVRQLWQQHSRDLPRLRSLPSKWLQAMIPLIGVLAGEKTRRALRGLPPVLAYLAEDQAFQNTDTQYTLTAAGLPLPQVQDYLPQVLGYYLANQRQRRAP